MCGGGGGGGECVGVDSCVCVWGVCVLLLLLLFKESKEIDEDIQC